jgi:hypothetical protein
MKGIKKKIKSPLFCFHGNCGKVCLTDSDFFGLSRSTRCGCCSYQVSSSARFFGDALIKLDETLEEYHMPCEVVFLRVDFFQNGCRCHGNDQNAKKTIIAHYSPNRNLFLQGLMNFDEGNKKIIYPPLFYFHGNCGKVCPTDSDFFVLSRSTKCGCDRQHYCKNL